MAVVSTRRSARRSIATFLAWLCGGGGLILLICAAYSAWEARQDQEARKEAGLALVVENPDYVFDKEVQPGEHTVSFRVRNPGRKPMRIVSSMECCGFGICPKLRTELPVTLQAGESGTLDFDCTISAPTRFHVAFPVFYGYGGVLKEAELRISGADADKDSASP